MTYADACCTRLMSTQVEIYEDLKPLTLSVLDGYNCCVFAYGQTGTGKTYTMQGPVSDPGVTYRAVKDLFETAHRSAIHGYTFSFRISVLEIYNERVFDLLVDPRTAQVCSRMLTYAHICCCMLTYADLSTRAPHRSAGRVRRTCRYTSIWQKVWCSKGSQRRMLTNADVC
jgi:hypothetical protein